MSHSVWWFVFFGAMLVLVGVSARWIDRLPLSPALAYLVAGGLIGPAGLGLLHIDVAAQAKVLEVLTEAAVLLSLFGVGLRLRLPQRSRVWQIPLLLAGPGMVLTTVFATVAAHLLLGLPWAAALLLAAILSPTDPVLASEVQLRHSGDRDSVRLTITAEGGFNDGTAFPAVMLALGLFGAHPLGPLWLRWLGVDVLWALGAALALGWACGAGMGRVLGWLRRTDSRPQSEEFLVLGAIAFTYGIALLCSAYGFVAVFVAALGLAHAERRSPTPPAGTGQDSAGSAVDITHSEQLLRFAGQCERLMEMVVVLVVGAALAGVQWHWSLLAYAAALLVLVRPAAVMLLPRGTLSAAQRRLVAWFGIRGLGSVYYLCYALGHGAPGASLQRVIDATLVTIAVSVVVHGVSSTPLMHLYRSRQKRRGEPGA